MLRSLNPLLLAAALVLAGCAGAPTTASLAEPATLSFLDSRIFDANLSRALAAGYKEVTVETPAGVTLNSIPERMDKWLYAVSDANNKVVSQARQDIQMRSIGLVALIQAIATGTYGWLRDEITYAPAKNYDATLVYDKETGNVEKIVFSAIDKAAAAAAPY